MQALDGVLSECRNEAEYPNQKPTPNRLKARNSKKHGPHYGSARIRTGGSGGDRNHQPMLTTRGDENRKLPLRSRVFSRTNRCSEHPNSRTQTATTPQNRAPAVLVATGRLQTQARARAQLERNGGRHASTGQGPELGATAVRAK